MIDNTLITPDERTYLRELAREVLDCANLPIMEERKRLLYAHNAMKSEKPIVVMEEASFQEDMLPVLRCTSKAAKDIERNLVISLTNFRLVGDDKVISPYYPVYWHIAEPWYGVTTEREYAADSAGRKIGFVQAHPTVSLDTDLAKLSHQPFHVDRDGTAAWRGVVEEAIGDILPVKLENSSLRWHTSPSQRVVELMGLQNMMFAMVDEPDAMHELYRFIVEDMESFLRWQEKEGLLVLNNGNHYCGAGSFGFTEELPTEQYRQTGRITTKDLWGNMNSQETVGISPAMFEEFILPSYMQLGENFGLTYFGCCEPVHAIWDTCISKLPHLRKVSISAWCDEEMMGQRLRNSGVIYSRKPSPNFIGVGEKLDEEAFRAHIARTLTAARGCTLEIIFRDIYTVTGDRNKPGQAIQIVRELIESMW